MVLAMEICEVLCLLWYCFCYCGKLVEKLKI